MAIIPEPLCRSLFSQKRLDPPDSGILGKVSMDVVSRGVPTALSPLRPGRRTKCSDLPWCWYYGDGGILPDVVIEKLNLTNISQLRFQKIMQLFFVGNLFSFVIEISL